MNGLNGGFLSLINLFVYFFLFTNCQNKDTIDVTFKHKTNSRDFLQTYSLKKINTIDSCIYIYENKEISYKIEINKEKELLFWYYDVNDYSDVYKKITNKQFIINNKIIEVISFEDDYSFGDLLYFLFTKEYGLILSKSVLSEIYLIKFGKEKKEINELIKAIKEDSEFYKFGGREYFPPPTD